MKLRTFLITGTVAFALAVTGCGKKAETQAELQTAEEKLADAEKKAVEAQQQLDDAKREAAQAQQTARQAPSGQAKTPAAASGWGQGPAAGSGSKAAPATAAAKTYTIPAGTAIVVRTITGLSTKTSEAGAPFEATLHQPLVVDGYTVAARGANVTGRVTDADPGGKVKGVATISVALTSLTTAAGDKVDIQTGSVSQAANKSTKKDAMKVGIGSGIGAAIGAIAGGGKGAAIGAGAGAAAGTGAVVLTRGDPATIPSESVLTFTLRTPVTVTAKK